MSLLTPLDQFSYLSSRVLRVLGCNPGPFTLQGTNTYLVGASQKKILIDTGDANISAYTNSLKQISPEIHIVGIYVTHWHHDHIGGVQDVLNKVIGDVVPVYKIRRREPEHFPGITYVDDGFEVSVPGATLRVISTPGHTTDHASLWLEEEQAIFSGDCILGEGTTVFEDLHDYMKSLHIIEALNPRIIYPGHGPVISEPATKISEYIQHRMERERQIVAVLANGEMGATDIVASVYPNLAEALRLAALNNVTLHLNKLVKDGKVVKSNENKFRLK